MWDKHDEHREDIGREHRLLGVEWIGKLRSLMDLLKPDWFSIKVWMRIVAVLVMLLMAAGFLIKMQGPGEKDAEVLPPDAAVEAPVIANQGDASPGDDGDATPAGSNPPIEQPSPVESAVVEPPTDQITFSSIVEHARYVGSWANEEIALQLDADGTYVYRSAGVETTGEFRVTEENGEDKILFMDSDDPGGDGVIGQRELSLREGVLVYGQGDAALQLSPVAELPAFAVAYPPSQRLDFSAGPAEGGYWSTDHASLQDRAGRDPGAEYALASDSATGGLDADVQAGTLSGEVTVSFSCRSGACERAGQVTGTAIVVVASAARSGTPGLWIYQGTADVTLAWEAETDCDDGVCTWPYTTTLPMDFDLRLRDNTGEAFWKLTQTEGTAGPDVAYSIRITASAPYRSS